MKKVSIVTVNYNHGHVTEALLKSLDTENDYENIEVIVVDNASKENPVPAWKERYKDVVFIRCEQNLGFAGGNNVGIRQATGDYFFLINNDTEVTKGLIHTLVSTLESHPNVGMVSPKIRYFDKPSMLQYAGYTPMNYFTARNACIGQFEADRGQYDHVTGKTGYVHGAAMMVRKEAIDKAGLMAENYFLYYEELDWCDRIKRKGFEAWVDMRALIYHKESISVGKKSPLKEYFMNRNRMLFIRRNAPAFHKLFFFVYFLLVVVPRNLLAYKKDGDKGFAKQLLRAVAWNFSNGTESKELGFKP